MKNITHFKFHLSSIIKEFILMKCYKFMNNFITLIFILKCKLNVYIIIFQNYIIYVNNFNS